MAHPITEGDLPSPAPVRGAVIRMVSHRSATGGMTGSELEQLARGSDIIGLNAITPAAVADRAGDLLGWFGATADDDRAGNAVLWRPDVLLELARGQREVTGAPAPATWVCLHHRASGVVLTWVQCHLDGAVTRAAMHDLLGLVREAGRAGEVVVAGDWGRCARTAREHPDPISPFAVLEQGDDPCELPGLRSTYSFFGFLTPATSGPADRGEYRQHLSILRDPDPGRRALTFASHRVLSHVHSDHRPIQAVVHVHADDTGLHGTRRGRH